MLLLFKNFLFLKTNSFFVCLIAIITVIAILLIFLKRYFNGGHNSNTPDLSGKFIFF